MKNLLIVPAYNEEKKIGNVVNKSKRLADKVLVINDGSSDKTSNVAKKAGAIVIDHPVNLGVGAAIRTGIEFGLKNNFEILTVIGGDDQFNPKEMSRMTEKIKQGYDFVQGSRYHKGGKMINIPTFRRITTKLHALIFSLLVNKKVTDGTNGFRAFNSRIFKDKRINLNQKWLERYELEVYLYYKVLNLNYKYIEVPITMTWVKEKGYTKMIPIVDWWRILRPLIFLRLGIKK
tara:strand:+ start:2043 stop:2741 length:699 start_codon:yes stop_codon:yes gene_type:complete